MPNGGDAWWIPLLSSVPYEPIAWLHAPCIRALHHHHAPRLFLEQIPGPRFTKNFLATVSSAKVVTFLRLAPIEHNSRRAPNTPFLTRLPHTPHAAILPVARNVSTAGAYFVRGSAGMRRWETYGATGAQSPGFGVGGDGVDKFAFGVVYPTGAIAVGIAITDKCHCPVLVIDLASSRGRPGARRLQREIGNHALFSCSS